MDGGIGADCSGACCSWPPGCCACKRWVRVEYAPFVRGFCRKTGGCGRVSICCWPNIGLPRSSDRPVMKMNRDTTTIYATPIKSGKQRYFSPLSHRGHGEVLSFAVPIRGHLSTASSQTLKLEAWNLKRLVPSPCSRYY